MMIFCGLENLFSTFCFLCRKLLLHSKKNKRVDKKLDIYATLKRSEVDQNLFWASKKLKEFGAFSSVDDCYVSGKTRVKLVNGDKRWYQIGHEDDLFRIISHEMKEKLLTEDTLKNLGNSHLKCVDF